jgi:erythromycin esterase
MRSKNDLILLLMLAFALTTCARVEPVSNTPTSPVEGERPPEQERNVAPEISNWLRENAIPFDTTEPDSDFDDLMPLKEIIGDSRVVALGEATHGTHEFFQMKHRLLRFLVEEMGFNTFAIEANWPEANLVNDYVHTGEGDPAKLLKGLHFWTWDTQEVLDMIRWMRVHNENPGDAPKVSFFGFDMQYSGMAMDNVVEYIQQVDPENAPQLAAYYDCFRDYENKMQDYAGLPSSTKSECRGNLQAAYDWLNQWQDSYEEHSSSKAFARALQNARIVLQAEDSYGDRVYVLRERYMAENVTWLLDQAGPEAKIVLWAHNGHVGTSPTATKSMGTYLQERYGDEMVVFGFSFYSGAFNAIRGSDGSGQYGMTEFQIALPPEESYEHYFHSAGCPRFFLDLRDIQAGSSATDWLLTPHPFRSIGAIYDQSGPQQYFRIASLPQMFDALIYLQDTTPSLLLEGQARLAETPPPQITNLSRPSNLDFETGTSGWILLGSSVQYYANDTSVVAHAGDASGHLWSLKDNINGFGTLMQTFTADEYQGQRLRMSAYVKTENIEEWAGLWMRVDGSDGTSAFDNMQDRPIQGSTDWCKHEIVLDVPEDSVSIAFGVLMGGTGQIWVDDFQFEVVDQDVPTTN